MPTSPLIDEGFEGGIGSLADTLSTAPRSLGGVPRVGWRSDTIANTLTQESTEHDQDDS